MDFDNKCDLYGCMYNDDGECIYDKAVIKIPYYCGCRDEYDNGDYE